MAHRNPLRDRPVAIIAWAEVKNRRNSGNAWTEVHVPLRGMEALAPYVLAAVELPGMAVRVAWETLTDEISLYVFEPAGG